MRILVGMSGGLDSTYAAMKLKREGHDVEGAVLVMHDYTDLTDAQSAADAVGIRLHEIDCKKAFDFVKENFVNEYKSGRTPNPCIVCNPSVKFKFLAEFAIKNGFDKIATGHYASVTVKEDNGATRYTFSRAKDAKKDQTYMLCRLPQDIIKMLILPLDGEKKADIRREAESLGIFTSGKKDSQEICFIPDGDYASYIEEKSGRFPEGNFIDDDGNILGRHKGIIRYTLGQRKGLGISLGQRAFVTEINVAENTVKLSKDGLFTDVVTVSDIVYTGMSPVQEEEKHRLYVKTRYLAEPVLADVTFFPNRTASVKLDSPVKAVTPGQSAVMYDGDALMAGGFID